MEIVIIGDGKVGFAIAGQLDREGHNVTVIDSNQAVLDKTSNLLDVVGIYGNGATPQTLKEAGADHADLVIAATSKDEINILSCLLAKKMGRGIRSHASARLNMWIRSIMSRRSWGFLWISIRNWRRHGRSVVRCALLRKFIRARLPRRVWNWLRSRCSIIRRLPEKRSWKFRRPINKVSCSV